MWASAWNDGKSTYGIRVGMPNRDKYFDPTWKGIDVEIEGKFHHFALTAGFWNHCPEFRDRGSSVIRDWLKANYTLDWPAGSPPRFELRSLGGNRFRLVTAGSRTDN